MRGVEAPFQLLISVFAMGLVLMLSYHVLSKGVHKKCEDFWSTGLTNLSLTLQQVGEAAPPTYRPVSLELKCGESKEAQISIKELSAASCKLVCGESKEKCYAIEMKVFDVRNRLVFQKRVCLRISPYIYYTLGSNNTGGCTGTGEKDISSDLKSEDGFKTKKAVLRLIVKKTSSGLVVCEVT